MPVWGLRSAETIEMVVAPRGKRQRRAKTRIPLNSLLEELKRSMDALSFPGMAVGQSAQIELIGSQVGRWTVGRTCDFGRLHRGLDDAGDARCNLVLNVKDVFQQTVKAVRPEMRPAERIDQLGGDAHPPTRLANRAFEHVADAELAAHLLHVYDLAFVRKTRIAGDDEEPTDAGERGDDLLDHAVGEVFLLWIAAEVLERQHRDRRLVGERQ